MEWETSRDYANNSLFSLISEKQRAAERCRSMLSEYASVQRLCSLSSLKPWYPPLSSSTGRGEYTISYIWAPFNLYSGLHVLQSIQVPEASFSGPIPHGSYCPWNEAKGYQKCQSSCTCIYVTLVICTMSYIYVLHTWKNKEMNSGKYRNWNIKSAVNER